MRDSASYDLALVSVAAVEAGGGAVHSARFVLGEVAQQPWRVEAASDRVLHGAAGHGRDDFKTPLARRVLAGVLAETASP